MNKRTWKRGDAIVEKYISHIRRNGYDSFHHMSGTELEIFDFARKELYYAKRRHEFCVDKAIAVREALKQKYRDIGEFPEQLLKQLRKHTFFMIKSEQRLKTSSNPNCSAAIKERTRRVEIMNKAILARIASSNFQKVLGTQSSFRLLHTPQEISIYDAHDFLVHQHGVRVFPQKSERVLAEYQCGLCRQWVGCKTIRQYYLTEKKMYSQMCVCCVQGVEENFANKCGDPFIDVLIKVACVADV